MKLWLSRLVLALFLAASLFVGVTALAEAALIEGSAEAPEVVEEVVEADS